MPDRGRVDSVSVMPNAKTPRPALPDGGSWTLRGVLAVSTLPGRVSADAWHRAVEAAAACGMLSDWPRPPA
jgi:hypothetical protein